MVSRTRRQTGVVDYWPSFVDVLSTILVVAIFLLSAFVVGHFTLTQKIVGKDTVLTRLQSQIADLTSLLALERANRSDVENRIQALTLTLADLETEKDSLQERLDGVLGGAGSADQRVAALENSLVEERTLSRKALSQVELLNQQIAALRRQIGALEQALEASEAKDRDSRDKIADLGRRLNVALARKVQELNRYRSDFFGRLRQILSGRSDIRIVGDRFVFPAELLFPSGESALATSGLDDLDNLAQAIRELEKSIPADIDWILRVDGHTDKRPIRSAEFPSNWELSSSRAISVVRYLIAQGVSPERLVAAGFGEYQPIDTGDSDEAFARNRRIELKLTEK